jgi:hypothetical protein
MESRGARAAVAGAVIAAAVVLFLVLRGGDDGEKAPSTATTATGPDDAGTRATKPTTPTITTITVRDGKPAGGVTELSVKSGERVRFRVRSDVADEVHVHGYDLIKDVTARGSVTFDFPAAIEGAFEIELEGRKEQLAELKVLP